MPMPSAVNTANETAGGCERAYPERTAHERRSAGRGHGRREKAAEEGSGPSLALSESRADRRRPSPDLEHAEQVQPDQEEQQPDGRDEPGTLELEPPPQKLPARSKRDQQPWR